MQLAHVSSSAAGQPAPRTLSDAPKTIGGTSTTPSPAPAPRDVSDTVSVRSTGGNPLPEAPVSRGVKVHVERVPFEPTAPRTLSDAPKTIGGTSTTPSSAPAPRDASDTVSARSTGGDPLPEAPVSRGVKVHVERAPFEPPAPTETLGGPVAPMSRPSSEISDTAPSPNPNADQRVTLDLRGLLGGGQGRQLNSTLYSAFLGGHDQIGRSFDRSA